MNIGDKKIINIEQIASRTNIIANDTETVLIQNNTEIRQVFDVYNTPLTITLPNSTTEDWLLLEDEFIGSVIFSTGKTNAGSVTIPTEAISMVDTFPVVYKGEDVTSSTVNGNTVYTFEPTANKVYTFMFYWDGWHMICEVTGYEQP